MNIEMDRSIDSVLHGENLAQTYWFGKYGGLAIDSYVINLHVTNLQP